MKRFIDYIYESKKVYEFKIKIVGDVDQSIIDTLHKGLSQYHPSSCKKILTTPIQQIQADFPTLKNISVSVLEGKFDYPVTSLQLRDSIAEILGIPHANIVVRSAADEGEFTINHPDTTRALGEDYPVDDNQELVGTARLTGLLKELGKYQHKGDIYKGVNDQLLADNLPSDKTDDIFSFSKNVETKSPVGSIQNKIPNPMGNKK